MDFLAAAALRQTVGGLCQTAVGQSRAGAEVSQPLHPSRGDCQFALGLCRRRRRALSLHRLRGQGTHQDDGTQAAEFLRRFLLHVVPTGFVRIRHYGLLANRTRQDKLTRARQLLAIVAATAAPVPRRQCPPLTTDSVTPAALPLAAPTVLARTGALSPASCRSEGFHHEGLPVPLDCSRSVFTARDCPHGADGPRVSTARLCRLAYSLQSQRAVLPPSQRSSALLLFSSLAAFSPAVSPLAECPDSIESP